MFLERKLIYVKTLFLKLLPKTGLKSAPPPKKKNQKKGK